MRFFHLSDLHIGLKLMNHDLREDQEYILDQIAQRAREEQPDAVVIAGDVYDKAVPSAEAVEVFDRFILDLTVAVPKAQIMIISGNHDSAPRMNLFREILKRQNVHMIGIPPQAEGEYIEKVTMQDEWGAVHFYLLPFVKPSMVKQITGIDEKGNNLSYNETLRALIERENIDQNERNVLVSHQFYLPAGKEAGEIERMDSEIRTVGNIDEVNVEIVERFDYVALGHIHKPMSVGNKRFRYCGTPLACSVSEAGQQKGILVVTLEEKGRVQTDVIPLHPLREVRVLTGTLEEILSDRSEDYVTVILTDRIEYDVFDLNERIRSRYPNLLEIRRQSVRKMEYGAAYTPEKELDVFGLCREILGELEPEEEALLQDVILTVQENQ